MFGKGSTELVPKSLAWAPEGLDEKAPDGWMRVSAFDYCGKLGSDYQVTHYAKEACGRAFGPLDLARTLAFCRNLRQALQNQCIELSTARGDSNAHTNAAVLAGAYLVICCDYSVERVTATMGAVEAQRRFVCSWSRLNRPEAPREMSVADCWAGLELARRNKWLSDAVTSPEDHAHDMWVSNYKRALSIYDAIWLIPGCIMVSADPTTTALDPNPTTCNEVFPPREAPAIDANTGATDVLPSRAESRQSKRAEHVDTEDLPRRMVLIWSTDTACKDYNASQDLVTIDVDSSLERPKPFVSFLHDSGVKCVIRTNFANEPGMINPYDGKRMMEHNLLHSDICIDDRRGGMPDSNAFAAALEATGEYMTCPDDAILVHCKGGFGRSVMMACAIIIDRYDVEGAALLGWVRLCRPGAVTTPQQERFLLSMRGRNDLRRHVHGVPCACSLQ